MAIRLVVDPYARQIKCAGQIKHARRTLEEASRSEKPHLFSTLVTIT